MAKLAIIDEREVPVAPGVSGPADARGVAWSKCLSPAGYLLRLTVVELRTGGSLRWAPGVDHGDEGVYVLDGSLEVAGRPCPTGGAVIVEAQVATEVIAPGGATVVYVGSNDPVPPASGIYGPADTSGRTVHVVGPKGWFRSGAREGVDATWFADSTCPTCRISLFRVDHGPGAGGRLHSHSQDEIIYVLRGAVRFGPREYGPGTAFNIPGGVAYRVSYPSGADFLNYRRDVSEQRLGRDGAPLLEGALARGGELVGDLY